MKNRLPPHTFTHIHICSAHMLMKHDSYDDVQSDFRIVANIFCQRTVDDVLKSNIPYVIRKTNEKDIAQYEEEEEDDLRTADNDAHSNMIRKSKFFNYFVVNLDIITKKNTLSAHANEFYSPALIRKITENYIGLIPLWGHFMTPGLFGKEENTTFLTDNLVLSRILVPSKLA